MDAVDIFRHFAGDDFALVHADEHVGDEVEVGGLAVEKKACFPESLLHEAMRVALGSDAFDILGLDVLLVNSAVFFPATDEVGAEFLAVVGSVEGVDPAPLHCRLLIGLVGRIDIWWDGGCAIFRCSGH